jgi:hypothetical protein
MASATLTPYKSSAAQETFTLASQGLDSVLWRNTAGSRPLNKPYTVTLQRKIGPQGSKSNDHVILKVLRSETDATTGLPVTGSAALDISIPRNSTLALSSMGEVVACLASLLVNSTAVPATLTNILALAGGTDL